MRLPRLELLEPRLVLSTIAEFPTPTPNSAPTWIASEPNGSLWFTESSTSEIGMISPTSHATQAFATPTKNSDPYGIAVGPDGNLWFTEYDSGKIGMINPASDTVVEFEPPTADSHPKGIAAGPGNTVWFTEYSAAKIGMYNLSTNSFSEFPLAAGAGPKWITEGIDRNMWFTETDGDKIGMITPSGHITEYTASLSAGAAPFDITSGPDGNLWFTEEDVDQIGELNLSTDAITQYPLPTNPANSAPLGITTGPDGNLWFTEQNGNNIGEINPITHGISVAALPTGGAQPYGITTGPDSNLWFLENGANQIGEVTPTLSLSVASEPPAFISPNTPFDMTVDVNFQSGALDAGYSGNVTIALVNPYQASPGGPLMVATLGGTLTAAVRNGVATFTSLTLNQLGSGYQLMAYTGSLTTTLTTPVGVDQPPQITLETPLFMGTGKKKRLVGFELTFSRALDAMRAGNAANYTLTQKGKHKTVPVGLKAVYNAATKTVDMLLSGPTPFVLGGALVVNAQSPGGITDSSGDYLDGNNEALEGTMGRSSSAARGPAFSDERHHAGSLVPGAGGEWVFLLLIFLWTKAVMNRDIFGIANWNRSSRSGKGRAPRDGRSDSHRLQPRLLTLEDRPLFSTIIVDNYNASGTGSLGAAVATANNNSQANTIAFSSFFNTPRTITLDGSVLKLSDTHGTQTITAPAVGATISGGGLSQVLSIEAGVTAAFSGLTITGGSGSGAGLYNLGNATLTNCTITGNAAGYSGAGGGMYNGSTANLTLNDCTISQNTAEFGAGLDNVGTATLTDCTINKNKAAGGGGLVNTIAGLVGLSAAASLTVTDCTISGNSAENGGGVANTLGGSVILNDCTISGNSAKYGGGGLNNYGANSSSPANMTLNDCTISGNSAGSFGGGGLYNGGLHINGTATLTDCTISGNSTSGDGGGLYSGGRQYGGTANLTLANCTVSGNTAAKAAGGLDNIGTATLNDTIVAGNMNPSGARAIFRITVLVPSWAAIT